MQIRFYQQQRFIINSAIVGCVLVSIIGLLQSYNFNPLNIHFTSIPASTFINKNHASIYIEFFIPVLLIALIFTNSARNKLLYSAALTLSIPFLYVLYSFGTLISISLALIFSGIILSKNLNLFVMLKKNYLYLLVILIGSVIIVSTIDLSVLHKNRTFTSTVNKSTHAQRLAIYEKGISAIKDAPLLGFGYGAFRVGILPYISEVQSITKHNENIYYKDAHNDFLQQFLETGVFSGVLFIVFFLYVLYSGLSSLNKKNISDKNIFLFSISSGLLVLLLHAFISFPFHLPVSNFLIYLSAGFILVNKSKNITFNKSTAFKASLFLISIFLLAVLISTSFFNIRHMQSNQLIRDAAIAEIKERDCKKAISLIDKSNQLFKFDFYNQKIQAYMYNRCPQKIEKLRSTVDKLIKLNPTNFTARFLKGNLYLLENNPNLAFKEYYYIVTMLPNRAIGYIGMANWAIVTRKYKDARIFLEKAKALEPKKKDIIDAKFKLLPPPS